MECRTLLGLLFNVIGCRQSADANSPQTIHAGCEVQPLEAAKSQIRLDIASTEKVLLSNDFLITVEALGGSGIIDGTAVKSTNLDNRNECKPVYDTAYHIDCEIDDAFNIAVLHAALEEV